MQLQTDHGVLTFWRLLLGEKRSHEGKDLTTARESSTSEFLPSIRLLSKQNTVAAHACLPVLLSCSLQVRVEGQC